MANPLLYVLAVVYSLGEIISGPEARYVTRNMPQPLSFPHPMPLVLRTLCLSHVNYPDIPRVREETLRSLYFSSDLLSLALGQRDNFATFETDDAVAVSFNTFASNQSDFRFLVLTFLT